MRTRISPSSAFVEVPGRLEALPEILRSPATLQTLADYNAGRLRIPDTEDSGT
jgi:hypothetical protein